MRAMKDMEYKFEVEEDKRYPKRWYEEKGRVIVECGKKKGELIKKIAKKVKNI